MYRKSIHGYTNARSFKDKISNLSNQTQKSIIGLRNKIIEFNNDIKKCIIEHETRPEEFDKI